MLFSLCNTKIMILFVATFILLTLASKTSAQAPIVTTKYGAVQGAVTTNGQHKCNTFLNIPFARPPINELRFKKPVEVQSWKETLNVASEKGRCHSMPSAFDRSSPNESEDCLYLRVVAPSQPPKHKLPVIVWIYGGGYQMADQSDTPESVCEGFLSRGVVYVAINYRHGFLGFLSTGDQAAPGNFGLYDQVMGLRWVHENIGGFGGDPGLVTVMGGSSGASSAAILARYHVTNDYMHRVIQLSGSTFSYWAVGKRSILSEKHFSKAVGCWSEKSVERVECLRTKPLDQLLRANEAVFGYALLPRKSSETELKGGGHDIFKALDFHWIPVPDGEIIQMDFEQNIGHNVKPKPTLIGMTNDEAIGSIRPDLYGSAQCRQLIQQHKHQLAQSWVGQDNNVELSTLKRNIMIAVNLYLDRNSLHRQRAPSHQMKDMLYEIAVSMYTQQNERAASAPQRARVLLELLNDVVMFTPAVREASLLKTHGWDVWMYNYEQPVSVHDPLWSATPHYSDVRLALGAAPEQASQRHLLLDIYTNMAKYAVPSTKKAKNRAVLDWPQFVSAASPTHLKLNDQPRISVQLHEPTLSTWTLLAPQIMLTNNYSHTEL